MPFSRARVSVPYRQGECGSPSRSENAWWRRWLATHWTGDPSTASKPPMASAMRTPRRALNERWVKPRWYPTVTARPVTT